MTFWIFKNISEIFKLQLVNDTQSISILKDHYALWDVALENYLTYSEIRLSSRQVKLKPNNISLQDIKWKNIYKRDLEDWRDN